MRCELQIDLDQLQLNFDDGYSLSSCELQIDLDQLQSGRFRRCRNAVVNCR